MIFFSKTWEEHFKHLEAVFKWLEAADLKIKHSKCDFFKTEVHYLGFLVGVNKVQLLPGKVVTIKALEPPRVVDELRQFLGLVGFYRKLIPFFSDITNSLNKMLRKGATSNGQNNVKVPSKYSKQNSLKCQPYNILTLISLSSYLQMHLNTCYSRILHQEKDIQTDTYEADLIPIANFQGHLIKPGTLEHHTGRMLCSLSISSEICLLSHRYWLHIVLWPQTSNTFLNYRNVKPHFRPMGIRATAVQEEVWAHPMQEKHNSRCNLWV